MCPQIDLPSSCSLAQAKPSRANSRTSLDPVQLDSLWAGRQENGHLAINLAIGPAARALLAVVHEAKTLFATPLDQALPKTAYQCLLAVTVRAEPG